MGAVDPLAVGMACALLATLFAHAALTKAADLPLLEQHLAAYSLPFSALAATARALVGAEALVALLLLSPWRALGAAGALALLLVYAAAMAWHRLRGHELDCGCGSEPLSVSWVLVARNLGLAGLAGLAMAPARPRAMGLADFAVIAGAVVLGCLLYAALHQVLRHAGRGRARTFGRT